MKTLLTVLAIVLLATIAQASPTLVSDPQDAAIGLAFEIQEDGVRIYFAPNEPDGSISFDLSGIPTGDHEYQVRYTSADGIWGLSDFAPFGFNRPASVGGGIGGLRLVP